MVRRLIALCLLLLGSATSTHAQLCDATPPSNGTVIATPGDTTVVLSWSGFSDGGTGLSCANTYKLVYAVGAPPADCASGAVLYVGTGTSFTQTGLTNGVTYGYRVCALDNVANISTGATASASPVGAPPPTAWSRAAGSTLDDRGSAVASDGTNVFATGHFTGTINLGGMNLTSGGANAQNVYLARYSNTGAHIWSMRFSGTANDDGKALATNAAGDVALVGLRSSPQIDFGGGNQFGISSSDLFIVKYTGAGVYQWAKTLGGFGADSATGVAMDTSGNVIVVGYFSTSTGGVDFGGGALNSAGSTDAFIAKYSPSGTHLWSKRLGGALLDGATSVAVTSTGDVVVAGYFQDTVDFGGGALVSAGGTDMFVAKYAGSNGAHVWSKRFGSATTDVAYQVRVDSLDDVIVTGSFTGTVDFGGGVLVSAGGNDMALVKLAGSNGAHTWSKRFGSTSDDQAFGLTVDGTNNVALIGYFTGIVDFGGGNLIGAGGTDIVVAKYSPTGAHLASHRYGTAQTQVGVGIASIGNMYAITGYFQNILDLGQGAFTSAGGMDLYIGTVTP